MSAPLYTRDILRLAASIPHLVPFAELADGAECRSPTCGSRSKVSAVLDRDGRVAGVTQSIEACAFGQAAAALMGSSAIGCRAEEVRAAVAGIEAWLGGDEAKADAWPGLATLDPARSRRGRHGAILLPFRTLLAAIEEAE